MKRLLAAVLALILVIALAAAASADHLVLYATHDGVVVYEDHNKSSMILKTLKKGDAVLIEQTIQGWYATLVEDPGGMGQALGWIAADDLSVTPPCDHSWSDWVIVEKPSCTKKGLRTHVCSRCGMKEAEQIDKLPHSYGSWTVLLEPTCTAKGTEARWCSVCGHEQTRDIDKLPHNYGAWSVIVEATDHSAGTKVRTCLDCGHRQERSFDPEGTLRRGDKGDAVREIQQLLAEQGYLKAKGVDGSYGSGTEKAITKFQKDQGINPDGVAWPETIRRLHHDFGPWETVTPLSRYSDGENIRVCRECGYTEHHYFTAEPFLTRGDKGNGVKTVQRMLTALGYSCGEIDGSFGGKLETAWEAFCLEKGITPELDRLRPGDLDDLVNEWIITLPEGAWMGQGDKNAPINMILTVKLKGESNGMRSFDWTLSNLGSEKCRFVTLLYGYGKDHDFTADDLVVVIDGTRLKADGENRLSGSFTVNSDWSETISFCALATDNDGAVWMSNRAAFGPDA